MDEHALNRRDFAKGAAALAAGAALATGPARALAAGPKLTSAQRVLFRPGVDTTRVDGKTTRFHSFRIPSIVRTKSGALLAFAEGRVNGSDDYGNINLVYKRSSDNGASWSALGQVAGDGEGTWGNPTAVADLVTGRVVLFMSWNPAGLGQQARPAHGRQPAVKKITTYGQRRVRMTLSDDDGRHWSAPVDLTSTLTPPTHFSGATWAFDAVGPGNGIQTRTAHPGRLVVPAVNRNFYSDDHGATWKLARLGTAAHPMEGSSEATITELTDGTLYRNDRPSGSTWKGDPPKRPASPYRQVARGSIETGFSGYRGGPADLVPDRKLIDPACEGSALYYNAPAAGQPSRIVFLNAASTLGDPAKARPKLTLRVSTDEGRTWSLHRSLADDRFDTKGFRERGYTSFAKTADLKIGILAEALDAGGHYAITFRKVGLGFISQAG